MALAHTDSLDDRGAILKSLATRNRVVAVLRIVVPAAGAAALLLLVLQIYVTSLLRQYGVSGIRIDRGTLVVDAPQYSGTDAAGGRYTAAARSAHAALDNPQVITMDDVAFELDRRGAGAVHVTSASATADTARNIVSIPGVASLNDDKGMHGTLRKVRAELDTGITLAQGPVELTFADGTTLAAANMRYDSFEQRWSFERATLTLPGLPEATP